MRRILLIGDDALLAAPLATFFGRFEFTLDVAVRPSIGFGMLRATAYDAVILGVMLPEMDGFELCRTIRRESEPSVGAVPIIMLTARGDVMDFVVGLEIGADNYLPKPFEPRELLARRQTVLRRARAPAAANPKRLAFDGYHRPARGRAPGGRARSVAYRTHRPERAGWCATSSKHSSQPALRLALDPGLPAAAIDATRIRLLLRNRLDNAMRHGAGDTLPPVVTTSFDADGLRLTVRDHRPGVDEAHLPQLAQALYRPDCAHQRAPAGDRRRRARALSVPLGRASAPRNADAGKRSSRAASRAAAVAQRQLRPATFSASSFPSRAARSACSSRAWPDSGSGSCR